MHVAFETPLGPKFSFHQKAKFLSSKCRRKKKFYALLLKAVISFFIIYVLHFLDLSLVELAGCRNAPFPAFLTRMICCLILHYFSLIAILWKPCKSTTKILQHHSYFLCCLCYKLFSTRVTVRMTEPVHSRLFHKRLIVFHCLESKR